MYNLNVAVAVPGIGRASTRPMEEGIMQGLSECLLAMVEASWGTADLRSVGLKELN